LLPVQKRSYERANKAAVAKSVTLEVNIVQAQKLWLASSVGSLSLLLRKAGETADVKTHRITLKDLESGDVANDKGTTTTVVVMRATAKQEYTVPVETTDAAVADAKRKQPGL
jgi:pilus assembly protein CpaB